jgi:hypothetical protein
MLGVKEQMTMDFARHINWDACEQALKSLKIMRQHWVAKHVAGHTGVCRDEGMGSPGYGQVSKMQ